jgi:hypothetical protein
MRGSGDEELNSLREQSFVLLDQSSAPRRSSLERTEKIEKRLTVSARWSRRERRPGPMMRVARA